MKPLIDMNKTDDEVFIDFYRKLPEKVIENTRQECLSSFIPKAYGEKRTYSQSWSEYDEAKTNETYLTKNLLNELLFLADVEPDIIRIGRKGYSIRDKVFCMFVKVYNKSSVRNTESVLKELKRAGYIEKVPCFKTIDNFFKEKYMPELLDRLITLTTLPIIHLETTLAVDSTGFALSKYAEWNEYKWGKMQGKERVWRKAHIICGCKTNIILAIKTSEKDVGDSPVFPHLVKEAKAHYNIKEICADMGYLSRKNLQFVSDLGMMPFIPFKSNSVGNPKGYKIWRQMYEFFTNKRVDFDRKYHQRSNIESTNHMIKQRFGSNLTTKTFFSNGVELKIKALCHNLCVLVEESYGMGININFEDCVKIERNV